MMSRAEMVIPSDIEARLPVLTDQEVKDNLRSKIDLIRRNIELTEHVTPFPGVLDGEIQDLFSLTAEEYCYLTDMRRIHYPFKKIGRAETDRLQQLGFEVMKDHGLDENISRPYRDRNWTKDGVIDGRDGTSREKTLYPSQTINNLVFKRTKKFITTTGEILSVNWQVVDNSPIPF